MAHLLIVEDDELLRDGLQTQLEQAGHSVTTAQDGEIALSLLDDQRFDGVVLDIGLPKIDGMTLLSLIRKRLLALPVLLLTARDSVQDRIDGFNAGADDYLTKPFNQQELLARLTGMLRRSKLPAFGGSLEMAASKAKNLRVDPNLPLAWIGEESLELTQREWALLSLLISNAGQVVSREDVLTAWQSTPLEGNAGVMASNALEVYVHRLRRKLSETDLIIRNVRGLGYLLESSSSS